MKKIISGILTLSLAIILFANMEQRCQSRNRTSCHAGAADGFHQRFFDDAALDVQRQLAAALLRRAPANAVGQTGDVLDLLGLNPFALFRDGRRAVVRALGDTDHFFNFLGVLHRIGSSYLNDSPANRHVKSTRLSLRFLIITYFLRIV